MIISSIVLDGLDLTSENYYFHLSGFQDAEKDVVTNDLLSDGVAWGRSKTKAKTLVLDGFILSGGEVAEWALNKVLAPNGLKTLTINQKYQCQVEVTSRGSTADNSHAVTCQLTMPDPHLYAMDAVFTQLGATYSAEKTYPFTYPRTYGAATGGEGTITNDGNVDAYPVITIVGTCSGITVTNKTTGESISVSPALNEGDELVIDCRPDTCGTYLNGVANIGLKTSPGWIHCPPGDNQFAFARNSLENKKHCTVQLQSRYM